jgi:hypothetical protein
LRKQRKKGPNVNFLRSNIYAVWSDLDFRLEMVTGMDREALSLKHPMWILSFFGTPELSKQGVGIIFHYHILPSLNHRNGFVGICLDRAHGKQDPPLEANLVISSVQKFFFFLQS